MAVRGTPGFGRFYDRLTPAMRAALSGAGRLVRYAPGATIHQRGDDRPGLSIIETGAVRFSTLDADGQMVTHGMLERGACFGEMTLFIDVPRALDATAIGETRIIQVTRERFQRLLDGQPALRDHLLASLAYQLARALDLFDDERRLSATVRLAKTLLELADADAVRASQTMLAEAVGVSRVTIGKALAVLAEQGLVATHYGRIELPDRPALETWVGRRTPMAPIIDSARRGFY